MNLKSKNFYLSLKIILPVIFFGLTLLTGLVTYAIILRYNNAHYHTIPSGLTTTLQYWIFFIALFSACCGYLLIHTILTPFEKLLQRTEDLSKVYKERTISQFFTNETRHDELQRFYSIFNEVLTLLKTHLREKDLIKAKPLLDRMKQADQLASLGFFCAQISHEIRNPLGAIKGLVQLLDRDIPKKNPKKEHVNTILKSIERLNNLIENMLEFAKPCSYETTLIEINKIIRDSCNLMNAEFKEKKIALYEVYQDNIPFILADSERLQEVFLNIIRNAFQFVNCGGTVRITTACEKNGFISIRIFNTGSYIPGEDSDMIFVPFFTTQKDGTGLGLGIAYYIISYFGGTIRVESEKETGTTFIIQLPTTKAASPCIECSIA